MNVAIQARATCVSLKRRLQRLTDRFFLRFSQEKSASSEKSGSSSTGNANKKTADDAKQNIYNRARATTRVYGLQIGISPNCSHESSMKDHVYLNVWNGNILIMESAGKTAAEQQHLSCLATFHNIN